MQQAAQPQRVDKIRAVNRASSLQPEPIVKTSSAALLLIPIAALLFGCGDSKEPGTPHTAAEAPVVRIDGSRTVFQQSMMREK